MMKTKKMMMMTKMILKNNGSGIAATLVSLSLIALLVMSCSSSQAPGDKDPLAQSQQLVVVQANSWDEFKGILFTYERNNPDEAWKEVFDPFPVVLGLKGIAWGQGLEDYRQPDNQKVEGDKRSPAGIFSLTSVFGYKSEVSAQVLHMPYIHVDDQVRCIEDSKSAWYNQIVREDALSPDWDGADHMLRDDNLYQWGAFVAHNSDAVEQGGSCIFLHIWRGSEQGTLGCTAMHPDHMVELVYWLKSRKHPLLVQLPKSEYVKKIDAWKLPSIN
jgi:D-alanyl-D-alanine dipeptidase